MQKQDTHFLAFDKNWFSKNQKILLWFFNNRITRGLFRRIVFKSKEFDDLAKYGINKMEKAIREVCPNNIMFDSGLRFFKKSELTKTASENPENNHRERRVQRTILKKIKQGKIKDKEYLLPSETRVFFTDWNYSKMLYEAFKPIWWAMHYWDELVADKWVPQLSFGFSTLTAYPDAHAESVSVDGSVRTDPAATTYALVRTDTASASAYPSSTNAMIFGLQKAAGGYDKMVRSIFLYDSSTLGAGATISAVTMSVYGGTAVFNNTSVTPEVNIFTSSPTGNTNLVAGDFVQIGTTAQCNTAITSASWSSAAYNDFAFNATGISNVSKTSISKFGIRDSKYDAPGTDPGISGGTSFEVYGLYADYGSNKPKLVVTYTASTTYYQTLSATESSSVSLAKINSFYKVLSVSEAATTTINNIKNFYRNLSANAQGVSGLGTVRPFSQVISAIEQSITSLSSKNIIVSILDATGTFIANLSNLKIYLKTLSVTMTGISVISAISAYYRSLSATIGSTTTITKAFVFTNILSATMNGSATLSKFMIYCRTLAVQVIGITARIKTIMNGITAGIWAKTPRIKDTWTKTAKETDAYTKSARVKDDWNRTNRDL